MGAGNNQTTSGLISSFAGGFVTGAITGAINPMAGIAAAGATFAGGVASGYFCCDY